MIDITISIIMMMGMFVFVIVKVGGDEIRSGDWGVPGFAYTPKSHQWFTGTLVRMLLNMMSFETWFFLCWRIGGLSHFRHLSQIELEMYCLLLLPANEIDEQREFL